MVFAKPVVAFFCASVKVDASTAFIRLTAFRMLLKRLFQLVPVAPKPPGSIVFPPGPGPGTPTRNPVTLRVSVEK